MYQNTEYAAVNIAIEAKRSVRPNRYGTWRVPETSTKYPKMGLQTRADPAMVMRRALFQYSTEVYKVVSK
jgi:hypothetical protein